MATAELPNLDHFRMADAEKVYEPAEDTFLLCDAICQERAFLRALQPRFVLEIGSGSGCVITYTTQLLREEGVQCASMATDINIDALLVTQKTARNNNVHVECVRTDLVTAVEQKLAHSLDVLIFNPPYVPTESDEIRGTGIEVSWAGGIDGREVIDRLLPKLKNLMSPCGVVYMVVVKENKPREISEILKKEGFASELIITRRALNEELSIMKIVRL